MYLVNEAVKSKEGKHILALSTSDEDRFDTLLTVLCEHVSVILQERVVLLTMYSALS